MDNSSFPDPVKMLCTIIRVKNIYHILERLLRTLFRPVLSRIEIMMDMIRTPANIYGS